MLFIDTYRSHLYILSMSIDIIRDKMMETTLAFVIVSLLVPVFAKYAGILEEAKKGFSLIAGAGVLYLLSHSFEMTGLVVDKAAWLEMWGSYLFGLIGWIFVLVGALTVAYKLSMEE